MQHQSSIIVHNEKDLIQLLIEWENYSEEQACMHDQSRAYYRNFNYALAIPAIILSTVGGTGNIGISQDCNTQMLNIIFGSIGLVSASMFTIHRYLNLPEFQQQHDFYSDEFEKLSKEIHLQLIIRDDPHKTYASLVEFAKECKKVMDNLIDKAPAIPKHITNRESKKRGGKLTHLTHHTSKVAFSPTNTHELAAITIDMQRDHNELSK